MGWSEERLATDDELERGFRIAQARRLTGLALGKDLSPLEFAKLLGFKSQSTVYRWEEEGGETEYSVLQRISELSGASLDWILGGKGTIAPTVRDKRPAGEGVASLGALQASGTIKVVEAPSEQAIRAAADQVEREDSGVGNGSQPGGKARIRHPRKKGRAK